VPDPSPKTTRPPSPPPSPSDEAASSPASAPASPTSEPAGFIADAGPAFDPERAAEQLPPAPAEPAVLPPPIEWEQDTIEALLSMKGRALHAGIGVADEDWSYTELDLAAIAPPLTRICNRYEPIQRLAKHADPLVLLFALGGYGVRSLEERAAFLRSLEPADVEPIEPLAADQPINAAAPSAPPPPAPPVTPGQFEPGTVPQAPVDPEELQWQTGAGAQ
jgi:hypothetical protein